MSDVFFFFCKQKTAYEMRISDWSSDVCSSDLTPDGFAEAYREFVAAGWPAMSAKPEYGGQGLPFILQLWLDEMISAANLSFGLFPGLTRGACEAVMAHASAELKDMWLPRLISGEWTGAMALTESGAGTDHAPLKTKAAPNADGSYSSEERRVGKEWVSTCK